MEEYRARRRNPTKIIKFTYYDFISVKKQFILISFLFCLMAPAMVTYIYLSHQKKQLKREVKWEIIAGIDKSELVMIHLSKVEAKERLEWEHSKEFEFQGEMYDVVEFEETADSVKYWCWWDYEETALNQNLAQVVDSLLGNHTDKKEKEDKLITFYQSLFSEKIFQWNAWTFASISNQLPNYQFSLKTYIDKTSTPPPKFII